MSKMGTTEIIFVIFILSIGCLAVGSVIMAPFLIYKAVKQTRVRYAAAQANYASALHELMSKPHDPNVRIKCLNAGRDFYQITIPDTVLRQGGQRIAMTDNSANREARIAADIEARIGHLNLKKSA